MAARGAMAIPTRVGERHRRAAIIARPLVRAQHRRLAGGQLAQHPILLERERLERNDADTPGQTRNTSAILIRDTPLLCATGKVYRADRISNRPEKVFRFAT